MYIREKKKRREKKMNKRKSNNNHQQQQQWRRRRWLFEINSFIFIFCKSKKEIKEYNKREREREIVHTGE